MKSPLTELNDYVDSIYEMGFTYDPGQVISKLLTLISKLPPASLPVTADSEAIDYKAKYEKCIATIRKFDAGIIGMYDL